MSGMEKFELNANEKEEEHETKESDDDEGIVEGDGMDGMQVGEQDAGDMRKMKKMIDPKLPSKEAVDDHEKTHLPFRNCAVTA